MDINSVGSLLFEMREKNGLDIRLISKEINISVDYLRLIEEQRFYELPSFTHAFNFTKKYSEYLGFSFDDDIKAIFLDNCDKKFFENKILSINDINESLDKEVQSVIKKGESIRKGKMKTPQIVEDNSFDAKLDNVSFQVHKPNDSTKKAIVTASIVVMITIVAFAFLYLLVSSDKRSKSVDLSDVTIPLSNVSSFNFTAVSQHTSVVASNISLDTIEPEAKKVLNRSAKLIFNDSVWVSVTSDINNTSSEYMGKTGDEIYITFLDHMNLDIGNAAGIKVVYGNDTISNFGSAGETKHIYLYMKGGHLVS